MLPQYTWLRMGETGTFKLFCNSADWFGLFEGKFCKSYQKISVLLLLSNSTSNNFPTERRVCVCVCVYAQKYVHRSLRDFICRN